MVSRQFLCFLILVTAVLPINAQPKSDNGVVKFSSKLLNENRMVQIHLPKSYWNTDKTYPVLFVLDGEHVFKYAQGTVDFLSNDFGFIPEMIVVGIPNTDRNRDLYVDFKPNGSYLNFVDFLEKELGPFIDDKYRTNPFKIIYGWSSGSGLTNYVFVKKPELFNGYILSGGGIGPKTVVFIKNNLDPNNYKGIHLFASTEGSSFRMAGLKKHETLIKSINPEELQYQFKIYDHLNHTEVLSQGLYDGLKFVFKDFYIPDFIVSNGSKNIITYYQRLEKTFGFKTDIPIGSINEMCAVLVEQNKIDEALELVNHGLRTHPDNPVLLGAKAEVYQHQNQLKIAAEYFQKALLKSKDSIDANKYKALYKSALKTMTRE
nr:alpha/beta hydrolase-fold protein [uncultured Allomuricauda sp.]